MRLTARLSEPYPCQAVPLPGAMPPSLPLLPRLYLGTMTFAWSQASASVDLPVAISFLSAFHLAGGVHVDTARIYANGDSEVLLGQALATFPPDTFVLGTKAHCSLSLSAAGMQAQFDSSLKALKVSRVHDFYLHQPDPNATLLESLAFASNLVKSGKVDRVGMSNYHADEVSRAFELCKSHGLVPPSLYQGLYNPLNRSVEQSLLPVLRANGASFVAYNPLAAGVLAGKHSAGSLSSPPPGRFKNNPNYLPRFYTASNLAVVENLRLACSLNNVSLLSATYRWLLLHSALTPSDGLLLGASSPSQLADNLAACEEAKSEKPLPPDVKVAFDEADERVKKGGEEQFFYWRSFSKDMPAREQRHHGASYAAGKK